jgi:hypothetical protein
MSKPRAFDKDHFQAILNWCSLSFKLLAKEYNPHLQGGKNPNVILEKFIHQFYLLSLLSA